MHQLIARLQKAGRLVQAAQIIHPDFEDDYYEELAQRHDPDFSIHDYAEEVLRAGLTGAKQAEVEALILSR